MHISSGDLLHRGGAADGFNPQRRLLGATAQHRPEVSEPTQYANHHTGYAWRYSKGCCRCDYNEGHKHRLQGRWVDGIIDKIYLVNK